MQTYDELVALARSCLREARLAPTEAIARELRKAALEYQRKAAELNNGKLPDIEVS